MSTFMTEISRLKLSNQEMIISTQILDKVSLLSEKGLGLGLSSCRREAVVPGSYNSKNNKKNRQFYQFYDESCLWSHLHRFDEKSILESKFKTDKKMSMKTQHVVSRPLQYSFSLLYTNIYLIFIFIVHFLNLFIYIFDFILFYLNSLL